MQDYDYTVIGDKAARQCIRNRLSAEQGQSVMLLEAGGRDKNFFIHMPAGYSQLVPKANAQNYGFTTEADERLNGRSFYWPQMGPGCSR